jgi:hypothetical protein
MALATAASKAMTAIAQRFISITHLGKKPRAVVVGSLAFPLHRLGNYFQSSSACWLPFIGTE